MGARSRVIGRGIPRREFGGSMFDLTISDEGQTLVELVHAFAERELRGAARDAEKARAVPAAVANALHALGVTCPIAEELGGQAGAGLGTYLLDAEGGSWGVPGIAHAATAP